MKASWPPKPSDCSNLYLTVQLADRYTDAALAPSGCVDPDHAELHRQWLRDAVLVERAKGYWQRADQLAKKEGKKR